MPPLLLALLALASCSSRAISATDTDPEQAAGDGGRAGALVTAGASGAGQGGAAGSAGTPSGGTSPAGAGAGGSGTAGTPTAGASGSAGEPGASGAGGDAGAAGTGPGGLACPNAGGATWTVYTVEPGRCLWVGNSTWSGQNVYRELAPDNGVCEAEARNYLSVRVDLFSEPVTIAVLPIFGIVLEGSFVEPETEYDTICYNMPSGVLPY